MYVVFFALENVVTDTTAHVESYSVLDASAPVQIIEYPQRREGSVYLNFYAFTSEQHFQLVTQSKHTNLASLCLVHAEESFYAAQLFEILPLEWQSASRATRVVITEFDAAGDQTRQRTWEGDRVGGEPTVTSTSRPSTRWESICGTFADGVFQILTAPHVNLLYALSLGGLIRPVFRLAQRLDRELA